jgi:hypothetical protein
MRKAGLPTRVQIVQHARAAGLGLRNPATGSSRRRSSELPPG